MANQCGDGSKAVTLDISTIEPRWPSSSAGWSIIQRSASRVARKVVVALSAIVASHARQADVVERPVAEPPAAAAGDGEEGVETTERGAGGGEGGDGGGLVGEVGDSGAIGIGVLGGVDRDDEHVGTLGAEPPGGRAGHPRGPRDHAPPTGEPPVSVRKLSRHLAQSCHDRSTVATGWRVTSPLGERPTVLVRGQCRGSPSMG